jgi:uncharacterized membrane protein SpoIIM required for sporulation
MVIESLINPFKAEKKPWEMFFFGFFYCSIAIFLALWVFQTYASLVMVFLTVLATTPLMYYTIKVEEKKDLTMIKESLLLKEHSKALLFFIMLFFGITIAVVLWYMLLPSDTVTNLFNIQQKTISDINTRVTGDVTSFDLFSKIFFNNIKVFIFCILFAFIYGLGAIFILTWNASVIGVAIGNFIRTEIAKFAGYAGIAKISGYFQIFSLGLLKYFVHGIPEILAYFTAGLAGSIISIAVIRHDYRTKKFEHVIIDSADLIILSIVLLFFAALLEVYVTPILF